MGIPSSLCPAPNTFSVCRTYLRLHVSLAAVPRPCGASSAAEELTDYVTISCYGSAPRVAALQDGMERRWGHGDSGQHGQVRAGQE